MQLTSFYHLKEGFGERAEFLTENVFIGLNPSDTDTVSQFFLCQINASAINRLGFLYLDAVFLITHSVFIRHFFQIFNVRPSYLTKLVLFDTVV